MAEETEKRLDEEREKIRNEGWTAGLTQGQNEITARNETIQSLQDSRSNLERKLLSLENDISRLNESREKVEDEAKEEARQEARKEVQAQLKARDSRIEDLQSDYGLLEDRLATTTTEIANSKKQLDEANKTVRKLSDQLKQSEVNKTPQEYGLLKEEVLVEFLIREFPEDQIIRTPGSHKGDVIQTVNDNGVAVGSILHERKETMSFDKSWVDKLGKDRLERGADFATLITKTMNKDDEPIRLYPNAAIMIPSKDTVKNIVAYIRWQIITSKSSVDDSRKAEMKANVDKCVESYRRQWVAMLTTAKSLKKGFEEMAGATRDGMEGITEISRMLRLPSPKPLAELPFRPQFLP